MTSTSPQLRVSEGRRRRQQGLSVLTPLAAGQCLTCSLEPKTGGGESGDANKSNDCLRSASAGDEAYRQVSGRVSRFIKGD